MSHPERVAMQNSDLNPFLYADVGTESNGSTLTMLSVLARLDHDPWLEAARWAKLSKAAAVESLIPIIDAIPLSPPSALGTRAAAARVVMLLPAPKWRPEVAPPSLPTKAAARFPGESLGAAASPRWLPIALLAYLLIIFLALNLAHLPGNSTAPTELAQTKLQASAAESR
jgi:hypothetical protein